VKGRLDLCFAAPAWRVLGAFSFKKSTQSRSNEVAAIRPAVAGCYHSFYHLEMANFDLKRQIAKAMLHFYETYAAQ
jgi:hypothetical protein